MKQGISKTVPPILAVCHFLLCPEEYLADYFMKQDTDKELHLYSSLAVISLWVLHVQFIKQPTKERFHAQMANHLLLDAYLSLEVIGAARSRCVSLSSKVLSS